ncbi:PREDICTED: uncharacterized protein LOC108778329 [Cyphomyrmex costatus]|uniref:uncharacterized protein LOC108778329 n=1 Tax=Cyphomyrmex costatus TaxID=456900 RepID=UPI0008522426|nr:PREDICTED: uncharacterized protein LOC108778329 [Cyphomyrmex costatus]
MRVHLLLILFFASTVLTQNPRNRRDTDLTTLKLPIITTTEAYNEKTTTDVTGDNSDGINCGNNIFCHPLKTILNVIKSIILATNNALLTFLKALNSTSDLALRAMMQPFVIILRMGLKILRWLLQFLN